MLLELEVSGFTLVEHMVLEFGSGLTVLTGETGAGKSIVLESLSFLLGSTLRNSESARDCRVAGRFLPTSKVRNFLEGQCLPVDDELLIIRERRAGGRTISRLNGSLVSVAQLKELSRLLIDFQGQHQSYHLTRASTHLPIVDGLAGASQTQELARYVGLYSQRCSVIDEIAKLEGTERQRLREMEWLRLEIEEIEAVAPLSDEEDRLEAEIKRLASSDELKRHTSAALSFLRSEGAALDAVALARDEVCGLVEYDAALLEFSERLTSLEIEIKELVGQLALYADAIEHEPSLLDKLQERSYRLKGLKRKYGASLDEVIQHWVKAKASLESLENYEDSLSTLQQRLRETEHELGLSAAILSKERHKVSERLCQLMDKELRELGIAGAVFQIKFTRLKRLGSQGDEEVEFLFSANPGCELLPLAEVASGGELSRLMLALSAIVSQVQNEPTLVFDEIDSGLGGRAAIFVAERLAELAQRAQVLVVTHLPVVASYADSHYVVEKNARQGATRIEVRPVDSRERIEEIARMLSGNSSPEASRKLAVELLTRKPHIVEEPPPFRF